jgi:hypothetical protein
MPIANIFLAMDLITGLVQRISAYSQMISKARAENRDITEAELDALAEAAGQALELARKRIEAMKAVKS